MNSSIIKLDPAFTTKMPLPEVSNIFKQFDSTSSSVVYRGLQEVKCKILKLPSGLQLFRENNGLQYLLRFVKKPNEKILDITLSILANLCLEDDLRSQVSEENGMIAHILGLISLMQKDSIIGRACRLTGNLAINQAVAVKLHQKGAISKLTETVKSKDASPGTKQMAVRALRLLWEAEINRSKMIQDQVVQTVASLLSTDVDDLLQAVLKALATFTHRCNEQCALQVQGEGKGFDELVASLKVCSKLDLPVSVIFNLCFVPDARPLLGTAGVVEAMINLTGGKTPPGYYSNVISILCLLCRESVNRSKVRRNGGLEVLLETLRCGLYQNLEARTLNALLHFIYDEVGLEILIKEGLVPVLVNKLKKVVEKHGNANHSHCQKESATSLASNTHNKRIRLSTTKEESSLYSCDKDRDPLGLRTRELATTSFRFDSGLAGGQWSPGSSRSVEFSPDTVRLYSPPPMNLSCSPSSSALSPASHASPPSPLSDAYSPVCGYSSSEDERPEDTDVEAVVECEADSDCEVTSPCLKDKDDIDDIQEALSASLPSNSTSKHGLMESWCLLLLSRVSHMDSVVDDMVSSSTVDTLLQYYTLLDPPHPRAARILQRITRNHHYLVPLLRAGLVLKVNGRLAGRIHENCSRCSDFDSLGTSLLSQLSLIAESGFGEGQIVHHLKRSTRQVQASLIVSIPYIIRTKKLLHLMLSCRINNKSGLDFLLQVMTNECGDGLSNEAVDSVSYLAQQIGAPCRDNVKPSKTKLCKRTSPNCSINALKNLNGEPEGNIIFLELENGASVEVKKAELCEESPMFSAMLGGSFRESGRQYVPLKDVSEECLRAVLSLLHAPNYCQCCLSRHNTNFAFEVLKLADRFILPKVVDKVADWLLSQLSPDIVPSFYFQAQNLRHVLSISEKLSKESLNFALSKDIDNKKRHEIFRTIMNSDFKRQFIDDLTLSIKFQIEKPRISI